jgi:DNA-binding NarL/FixJ family response regulator
MDPTMSAHRPTSAINTANPDLEIARRLRVMLEVARELALSLHRPDQGVETACEALVRVLEREHQPRTRHHGSPERLSLNIERKPAESCRGTPFELVSAREKEVLGLIGCGLSNKEIARQLGIGPETVKSHVKRIFEKLQVERRAQAVVLVQGSGLFEPRPVVGATISP